MASVGRRRSITGLALAASAGAFFRALAPPTTNMDASRGRAISRVAVMGTSIPDRATLNQRAGSPAWPRVAAGAVRRCRLLLARHRMHRLLPRRVVAVGVTENVRGPGCVPGTGSRSEASRAGQPLPAPSGPEVVRSPRREPSPLAGIRTHPDGVAAGRIGPDARRLGSAWGLGGWAWCGWLRAGSGWLRVAWAWGGLGGSASGSASGSAWGGVGFGSWAWAWACACGFGWCSGRRPCPSPLPVPDRRCRSPTRCRARPVAGPGAGPVPPVPVTCPGPGSCPSRCPCRCRCRSCAVPVRWQSAATSTRRCSLADARRCGDRRRADPSACSRHHCRAGLDGGRGRRSRR